MGEPPWGSLSSKFDETQPVAAYREGFVLGRDRGIGWTSAKLVGGWRFLALLLALMMGGCQQDTSAKPPFVTVGYGIGRLTAAPLRAQSEAIAGQSVPSETAMAKSDPAKKDEQYFIEFRSRYALSYGHSYVVFGRVNENGEMIDPEVAGLHPASKSAVPYVLGHIVPVPSETGWSDGDLEEPYRSASWRIMLSEEQYTKVVAYIRKLQASSPVWQASVYNCNAFVADIARSMGFKTPAIWLRPQQFMTKLREMNTSPSAADYATRKVSAAG